MDLGERLLDLRKSKKLSQEVVARELNVSRQTISKWETNQSVPDIDKILPLCELYGVTADELLTGRIVRNNVAKKKTTPKPTTKKSATRKTTKKKTTVKKKNVKEEVKFVETPVIVKQEPVVVEQTPLVVKQEPVVIQKEVIVEKRIDNAAKAKGITLGIFLFFVALLWLILATSVFHASDILSICIFLLLCAFGVCSIVYSSILYGTEEVVKEEKSTFKQISEVLTFIVFIIYLIVSIKTMKWHITWLIWVMFALVMGIIRIIIRLWEDR